MNSTAVNTLLGNNVVKIRADINESKSDAKATVVSGPLTQNSS